MRSLLIVLISFLKLIILFHHIELYYRVDAFLIVQDIHRYTYRYIRLQSSTSPFTNNNNDIHRTNENAAKNAFQKYNNSTSTSSFKKKKRKKGRGHQISKNKIRNMFREAKNMERCGKWSLACEILKNILKMDPHDAHSHLALGRLESRREKGDHLKREEQKPVSKTIFTKNVTPFTISQSQPFSKACQIFYNGTIACPESIHLWQCWALHEQSMGNIEYARTLFQKALSFDKYNPYVAHAFGMLEQQSHNINNAIKLWERPLNYPRINEEQNRKYEKSKGKGINRTTAALVTSLGKAYISLGRYTCTRNLYREKVKEIDSEREKSEVYLAAAWLEEKHFKDMSRAEELLNVALTFSPGNSRVLVALARLEGRRASLRVVDNDVVSIKMKSTFTSDLSKDGLESKHAAMSKKLRDACTQLTMEIMNKKKIDSSSALHYLPQDKSSSEVRDGRLFTVWADLEVKNGNLLEARHILKKGMDLFPKDTSVRQAIGKVEELSGNYLSARKSYSASLAIQPTAPTLVSFAMLELRNPKGITCNFSIVRRLFEEALLLDPRHGPAYNAYGNMEMKRGNTDKARLIYSKGIQAHCTDTASVYHGLAKLELSLGNIAEARSVLVKGLKEVDFGGSMMDSSQHKRAIFLTHTLGMLELNSNRVVEAKVVFEDGINRHGNSSQLLLGAAFCEVKLGREGLARVYFERSVHADRKHAQAWQSWGVMEMKAGNYKVGKTLFECGIQNDSSHGALWQAYATMESRRGSIDTARALFAKGVMKCPQHAPLYQAWACLELREKKFKTAKILIGEALTRDKTQSLGWLVAAKIEEKLGSPVAGLILKRGLSHCPSSVKLYCALAEYEIEQGKIELARELLERAISIEPHNAPLYHILAELEARVCNVEGLAILNRRVSAIFKNNPMEPSSLPMKALAQKLRSSKDSKDLPPNIGKLLHLVSPELNLNKVVTEMDPDTIINRMNNYDDIISDILSPTPSLDAKETMTDE